MRIDVLTIFPEYLEPLRLSLVGKAVETGLVQLSVHDLRSWTHDRHRSVDDTPYGGGAGMVMKPEPWGEALDELTGDASRLVVLTPAGRPFTQRLADELATEQHLVVACGRYEGIDARVVEYARTRLRVDEVSIGDYVVNGGEAAALVLAEAVVRLIPGVIGNPTSLAEESHALGYKGLLEYPVYTKPPSWRGLEVPEVLLSGHHGQIASWRREQAVAVTRNRRPELLPAELVEPVITAATLDEAGELLTLQRAAFVTEAQLNEAVHIPPLTDGLEETVAAIEKATVLVARRRHRLVGGVRGGAEEGVWFISRLMVAPDERGFGLGSRLLTAIEALAPDDVASIKLMTGPRSRGNLEFYGRRGYQEVGRASLPGADELVVLEKSR